MCSMAMGDFCPGKLIQMIGFLITKLDIPDRKGGYVAVVSLKDGRLILHAKVGDCPIEKANKYCDFSLEKALRVYNTGKKSSWETRDIENEKYGGGIAAGNYAIAFSGLPEKDDEAVVAVASQKMGFITSEEVSAIELISSNDSIKKLCA